MTTELHRLFFALWPDDALRDRLSRAASQLRMRENPGGRWINAQRYHLTLVFVGDFPGALPPGLMAGVAAAASRVQARPFELQIDRAGSFRNREIPWWLGPAVEPPELRQLWQQLRDTLRAEQQPFDTKLRLTPHLTVARNAGRALAVTPIPPMAWPVNEFVLIHSILGPNSRYELVGRWALDPLAPLPGAGSTAQLNLWENDRP